MENLPRRRNTARPHSKGRTVLLPPEFSRTNTPHPSTNGPHRRLSLLLLPAPRPTAASPSFLPSHLPLPHARAAPPRAEPTHTPSRKTMLQNPNCSPAISPGAPPDRRPVQAPQPGHHRRRATPGPRNSRASLPETSLLSAPTRGPQTPPTAESRGSPCIGVAKFVRSPSGNIRRVRAVGHWQNPWGTLTAPRWQNS